MLTFDIPKEILAPRITLPTFLDDISYAYILKLLPNSQLVDGFIVDGGRRFKLLSKIQHRYPSRYVRYGKQEATLGDGYILCAVSRNYSEFYIFGLAHALQITPDGKSEFYIQTLKSFGAWNSVECKRRGV